MTINELIAEFQKYDIHYAIYLGLLPAIALIYSFLHKDESGSEKPHKYVYSGLVHLAAFPGVCGIILSCYSLFILQDSLLDVSFVIYFLPVITMILTIYFVSRIVRLGDLIFIFFGGSIKAFGFILLVLFALVKWGSYKLLKKSNS